MQTGLGQMGTNKWDTLRLNRGLPKPCCRETIDSSRPTASGSLEIGRGSRLEINLTQPPSGPGNRRARVWGRGRRGFEGTWRGLGRETELQNRNRLNVGTVSRGAGAKKHYETIKPGERMMGGKQREGREILTARKRMWCPCGVLSLFRIPVLQLDDGLISVRRSQIGHMAILLMIPNG
jgi:hypothetical protein